MMLHKKKYPLYICSSVKLFPGIQLTLSFQKRKLWASIREFPFLQVDFHHVMLLYVPDIRRYCVKELPSLASK